jgi:hypothetical protein
MKQWLKKFWYVNGERHVYGFYAFAMACGFLFIGREYSIKEFDGAGATILIGIAMYCFNKVRGNGKEKPEDKP